MRALVNERRVAIGMTEQELIESCGGRRVSKQWIYSRSELTRMRMKRQIDDDEFT